MRLEWETIIIWEIMAYVLLCNGVQIAMQAFQTNPRVFLPLIIDPAYHYEVVNVENQSVILPHFVVDSSRSSRQNHKAFGFGALSFVGDNSKVLALYVHWMKLS